MPLKKSNWLTLVSTLFLIGMILSPASLAAVPRASTQEVEDTASVTLQKNPGYSIVSIVDAPNQYYDLYASGTQTGTFTPMDKTGTLGTPVDCSNVEGYPKYLKSIGYEADDPNQDPWDDVQWLLIENNTIWDDAATYTYNINLVNENAGQLGLDNGSIEIEIPMLQSTVELSLVVEDAGAYVLFFDPLVTLTNTHLVNPNGTNWDFQMGSLPTIDLSGDPVRQFIIFVAENPGIFRFYFTSDYHYIVFSLKYYPTIGAANRGERVTYRDSTYEAVDMANLLSDTPNMPVHLYMFPTYGQEALKYNFASMWGDASVYFILPSPQGQQYLPATTDDSDNYIYPTKAGMAFLLIYQDQYYEWNAGSDAIMKSILYYKFGISNGPSPQSHTLGSSSTFVVDPLVGLAWFTFNVATTTKVLFNASIVDGTPSYGIIVGHAANTQHSTFSLWSDEKGYIDMRAIAALGDATHLYYLYEFTPGNYYSVIIGSGSQDTELLAVQSAICNDGGTVFHKAKTLSDQTILTSQMNVVESPYLGTYGILGQSVPASIQYTYDWYRYFDYTPTMTVADNPAIFERKLDDYQIWAYNGTAYNNLTTVAANTNLFPATAATTHYVYIGSPEKFDHIDLDLAAGATGSPNMFTVQMQTGDAAFSTLTLLENTTWSGNQLLGKSGRIKWDALQYTWTYDADFDPDDAGDFPGAGRRLYWIRIACNVAAPTSIPQIAADSTSNRNLDVYRFANINFILNSYIMQRSKYDGISLDQLDTETDTETLFDSNDADVTYAITDSYIEGTGDGTIAFYFTNMREYSYRTATAGVWGPLTLPIRLRMATADGKAYYQAANYPTIELQTLFNDTIDFTAYSTYGYTASYNSSIYSGLELQVSAPQMYDWYQFILRCNRANANLNLIFDNVWEDNTGSHTANRLAGVVGASNDSDNMGIALSNFRVELPTPAGTPANTIVTYNLNIARFGCQIITPQPQNNTVEEEKGGIPSWVLPTVIGIAIGVGVVVGGVFLMKKRRFKYKKL